MASLQKKSIKKWNKGDLKFRNLCRHAYNNCISETTVGLGEEQV
jgi:hypothetical protein